MNLDFSGNKIVAKAIEEGTVDFQIFESGLDAARLTYGLFLTARIDRGEEKEVYALQPTGEWHHCPAYGREKILPTYTETAHSDGYLSHRAKEQSRLAALRDKYIEDMSFLARTFAAGKEGTA